MNRTIICLAAKRSGTSAVHQVFAKHPDVKICHPDQNRPSWEPNFWNYAALTLDDNQESLHPENSGDGIPPRQKFAGRMAEMAPEIQVAYPLAEEQVFDLWDQLLARYGPVVFDKSPKYLGSTRALQLILKYMELGHDVRVFGIIRHPRDVIASQYERWHKVFPTGTPEYRDKLWAEYYRRFEWFQKEVGLEQCPLIRYEDLSHHPTEWLPFILNHCGLEDIPETYAHIRPVSIGRYSQTHSPALRRWSCSPELQAVAAKHGYDLARSPGTSWQVVARAARRRVAQLIKPILGR